jgi:type I restriction enzyme, S subunit
VCIHKNHQFRVRFPADLVDPDFASLQIASSYGKTYFLAHAKKTTGIASINQTVLGNLPLRVPALAEQQTIAGRLKAQLAQAQAMRAAAEAQLSEIELLPARLLAQAFAEPASA